ncbi:response regulator [Shewanella alkalitolerans]|uniref:ATP-binding protein n=1 Tax=Shewanella alkalitolerans TaxID=2864209 RepID=UPI001C659FE9|nr:ATP-binding protein [Shewanella alkalitolerans]QYJ98594.1 response regulator [Shewanella alkalitolerans]
MVRQISRLSSLFGGRSLLLAASMLVLVVALVIIASFESQLNQNIVDGLRSDLEIQSEQVNNQAQDRLNRYFNNLRFLFETPPISGLSRARNNQGIDPVDETRYDQWRHRLETIFVAFLQNNREYEQLRILSSDGMELIRVDRRGGAVQVIDDTNLQDKQGRDYFQASKDLQQGEIYTSPINLNREFGKIDYPYRPMLRLATPIFDDNGGRFGLLIVNINANDLLSSFKSLVPAPIELVLTDSDGYFLVHPDEEMRFSRDLHPDLVWDKHYQQSKTLKRNFELVLDSYHDNKPYYAYRRAITLSNDAQSGRLSATLMAPKQYVQELAVSRRISVYSFMLAVGVLFLFVVIILGRSARSSQALAKEKAQSAAIIDGSKDAIIGVGTSGVVNNWNRAAELLFGYDADYAKGHFINQLALLPEVDLAALVSKANQGNKTLNLDAELPLNEGRIVDLYVSVSPILGENKHALGVAIIIRDVSIEKQAAKKIQLVNAELEKKVAIRTQELQKASLVKSSFISNISHEMRTPLNGIVGTLNLVRKDSLTERQARYLEMAEVSVNTLSALINDVLDLSKIEAGKLDLDMSSFNPLNLIESVCSSMAVKAQEKGIEFVIDVVDLRCQSIDSDPHRITQILTNLINNAIKFTDHGYIKVRAHSRLRETGELEFICEVSDTGIGIAEENQAKLFTAFSQATSSIAAQYGGTGLGLSICKELSELLNGKMSFESHKGQGSCFIFTMVLHQGEFKLMAPEALLHEMSCSVLLVNEAQQACVEAAIARLGGKLLPGSPIRDWLNQDAAVPDVLPHVLIVEQRHSLLTDLDSLWPTLTATHKRLPRVLAFQKSADGNKALRNIELEYLNNPLLFSEFMQKFGAPKVSSGVENVHPQVTQIISDEEAHRIKGARVLVVDDNEINIEVALGILSELPLEFVRAINGQEALTKLRECEQEGLGVHCILMDCQMPILNGYDCTRAIRAGEAGEAFVDTPIIAMTASAMMGERDKCIEAGMNDYITKPIVAERLQEKVVDWLISVCEFGDLPTLVEAAPHEEIQVKDEDYVWNRQLALSRLMNNEVLFAEICQMYHDTSPAQVGELEEAIAAKDYEKVRQLSHGLKGLSSSIGAIQLQEQFLSLEMEAKMKNCDKLNLLFGVIKPCYAKLMERLQETLEPKEEVQNASAQT